MKHRHSSFRAKTALLLSSALLAQAFGWAGGATAEALAAEQPMISVSTEVLEPAPYVEGEVLVTYKAGVKSTETSRFHQSFRLAPKERLSSLRTELLKLPEGASVEETIAKLEANPLVEHAQPNYLYYPSSEATPLANGEGSVPVPVPVTSPIPQPEIPGEVGHTPPPVPIPGGGGGVVVVNPPAASVDSKNWGLHNVGQLIPTPSRITGTYGVDIDAVEAWSNGPLETVVVAVIDTGVDISHPDLAGKIWTNPGETPGNGIDDDKNGYVDDINGWDFVNNDNKVFENAEEDAHGTHVAGIIAARHDNFSAAGAATNVKIMPLKFLGEGENAGKTITAIKAIEYASANGARITNNSWNGFSRGNAKDELLRRAIENANSLFVGSAGNGDRYGDGYDSDVEPVAPNNLRASKQITVAAIDPSGTLARFSNYGDETVHIAAPGVAIYSTIPGGGYDFYDGTSMAAPYVAAAAAMAMGQKNLTVAETKQLLLAAGKPLASLSGKTVSGKLVNLYNVVSTSVTNVSVSLSEPVEYRPTAVEISFRTSTSGALKAGKDTFSLQLSGLLIPEMNNNAYMAVTVNNVSLQSQDLVKYEYGEFKIRTPIDIPAGGQVTIQFSEAVGIQTNRAGEWNVAVSTSADRGFVSLPYLVEEDAALRIVRFDPSDVVIATVSKTGQIDATFYAHVQNSQFAGAIGEHYGPEKYSVTPANGTLPSGLNVFVEKQSDTTVSISVYGENINPLTTPFLLFNFNDGANDGAFSTGGVIAEPALIILEKEGVNGVNLTNTLFVESDRNDGTIQTKVTAELFAPGEGAFAGAIGEPLGSHQVQFTGVPDGLTPSAKKIDDRVIEITMSGAAAAHTEANSSQGMTVTFLPAAFAGYTSPETKQFGLTFAFKDGPAKPQGVSLRRDGAYVGLRWNGPVNGADRIVISLSETGNKFFEFAEIGHGETSFLDVLGGFMPSSYYYRVDAYRGTVKASSEPVKVELSAEQTYFEGEVDLAGKAADQTKLTIKKADGTTLYGPVTYNENAKGASLFDNYGIGVLRDVDNDRVPGKLLIYFVAPKGSYEVLVENGGWSAKRTVTHGPYMLGAGPSEDQLELYHVGLIDTLTLAAPQQQQSPGGSGGGAAPPPALPTQPEPRPFSETPNGDIVFTPSAKTEVRGGREVAVVELTEDALEEALEEAEGAGNNLVIKVETDGAASARLPIGALAKAEGLPFVEVQSNRASYRLPKALLAPEELAAKFGVAPGASWTAVVEMTPLAGAQASAIGSAAARQGAAPVGEPVEFSVRVEANGRTFEYDSFGNVYVERKVTVDRALNAQNATAAWYDPATGALSFVPATFQTRNGQTEATLKRNGNSIYVLLEAKREFADMAGHWAEADVELLAGKLVLNGTGADSFSPEHAVTRAEFAAMLTRALGLAAKPEAAAGFGDVAAEAWYAGAIGAAVEAGLVTGFDGGEFRPNERITREQMAVMFGRALEFAGAAGAAAGGGAAFADQAAVSPWAAEAVAKVSAAGIVGGNPDGTFAPAAEANRAQAAVMLRRLLERAKFI